MRSTAACSGSPTRCSCSPRATSRSPPRNAPGCSKRASSTRVENAPGPEAALLVIVGLIGAGNMAGALARGWAAAAAGPDELLVSDADSERSRLLAEEVSGRVAASNRKVAEDADVLVLAMKPGALAPVAEDVRVPVADRHVPVVSILGATSISALEQALGP